MTREQESRRGEQARRLLDDPLPQVAFATVESALRDAWSSTADDAAGERERLWLMLKLFGRVRVHLISVIEAGRLADGQLATNRPSSPQ